MSSASASRVDGISARAVRLIGGETLVAAGLSLLLMWILAASTVRAAWVGGTEGLLLVALGSVLVAAGLAAARPVPSPAGLILALLLGAPVAASVAGPAMLHAHPGDRLGWGLLASWRDRVLSGDAITDSTFIYFVLCGLLWVIGVWLTWNATRWQQAMPGIAPAGAALATNVINFPKDQNGYALAFLVVTLFFLLWASYRHAAHRAALLGSRFSSDSRFEFWEAGAIVVALLVAVAVAAPPLTTVDRSVDIENGAFRGWAEMQQRLNHQIQFGTGSGGGNSIGFSSDVVVGGPIHKTGGVVMTYTFEGSYGGVRYFRGLDITETGQGRAGPGWLAPIWLNSQPVPKGTTFNLAEPYEEMKTGTVRIDLLKPPSSAPNVIFYPGAIVSRVDRDAVASQEAGLPGIDSTRLYALDRLTARSGQAVGPYSVTVAYSDATETELQAAGTDYPTWVQPYATFSPRRAAGSVPYRPPAVMQRIQKLAEEVTAGATTPYARAQAIERYLRNTYTYTLTPPPPAAGRDPLEAFLFDGKQGYCEYFATAMGDMLRSLGIPTRLVNGYGPGTYDDQRKQYVVKESDAHTWVEVYFPHYGWIPFEPTPDGTYFPITRGTRGGFVCTLDSPVCDPAGSTPADSPSGTVKPSSRDEGLGSPQAGGASWQPPAFPWRPVLIGLVALLLLGFLAVSRFLTPAGAGGVWQRLTILSRLAGYPLRPSETPQEFAERLARVVPEARAAVRELGSSFTVAGFAPPERVAELTAGIMENWAKVRPFLVRRVVGRFVPTVGGTWLI